ncbi:NAD(P)(+) transhydrogenase (Re/Si-specific) subunit beta [Pseudomarimonas arenosa]|uniref:NAD(P) transhydrogenase subunit beta n=1 Tax=Pseudomarimonas arenosa TaxID=2774145 RepID=A0AAW3ZKH5_9GAMM|nr:NAD(P)(+) transhydrogenase (Re/Si-specific) subunit beta [Pseudomarimonas arenosa]MBD8526590.1 NAD(P)(+) transhydrogenase (Re/Si-specific) subunit beta [Pseudomarimonas arenosa]
MSLPVILDFLAKASYFAAAVLFIVGLMKMGSPVTARKGIRWAGVGMVIATAVTFIAPSTWGDHGIDQTNLLLMIIAIVLSYLFWIWGKKVPITDMPQMVAIFNGMGGGSAAAIGAAAMLQSATFTGTCDPAALQAHLCLDTTYAVLAVSGALIGAVSFSGSVIAWAKLDGRLDKRFTFAGQQVVNLLIFLGLAGLGAYLIYSLEVPIIIAFFVVALLFGVLMTLPIGGADMPVVISLYNAFTGLAVAFEGYVLQNESLIIAGTVVGAAGMLLTQLMAKAMNRPITNVLFSNFGGGGASAEEIKGSMKPVEAPDAASFLYLAERVIVVPGYGMAVAQAQHKMWELCKQLIARDKEVKFAIHPVAGRMPGHMNVLLAEAGVPYDLIADMDDINPEFKTCDVAIVIGANDVVNPVAKTDKSSPIYGMPILDVIDAKQVIVIKRGKGTGFAGIENALFYAENCRMLYADGQEAANKLITELKALDGGGGH